MFPAPPLKKASPSIPVREPISEQQSYDMCLFFRCPVSYIPGLLHGGVVGLVVHGGVVGLVVHGGVVGLVVQGGVVGLVVHGGVVGLVVHGGVVGLEVHGVHLRRPEYRFRSRF